jgi:hypothetical protein
VAESAAQTTGKISLQLLLLLLMMMMMMMMISVMTGVAGEDARCGQTF